MFSKTELEELKALEEIYTKNDLFLRICSAYLNECERLVTGELIEEITSGERDLDTHAFATFLSNAFIENDDLQGEMHREYFVPSIKKLDPQKYENDPYYKNIPIPDKKIGNWTLSHQKYAPYEGFVRDDFEIFDNFREVCRIGFFDKEFSYPTVFENGVEWMAIKPNEIETMKKPIEMSRGRVVTFGLGLGYFTYMASERQEVSSVTVIEKSKDVISLFKKYILPYFSHPEKVNIIEYDAFEYVKDKMASEHFDLAFVDLWRDTSDGVELYIKMKGLEALCPDTKFEYWIERSILVTIRKKLLGAIFESIENGKNTLSYNEILNRLDFNYIREFVKLLK